MTVTKTKPADAKAAKRGHGADVFGTWSDDLKCGYCGGYGRHSDRCYRPIPTYQKKRSTQ